MEGYLPSEKARLVLGYLKEVGSLNTFKTFLSECPYLAEYASLYRRGHEYPLHIGGQTLSQILDDYAKIKSKGCRIPEPVASVWQSFESMCHELKMCYIPQMRLPVMGQSHRSRRGSMIQSLKNSFALSGNTHDSKTKNNDGDCKRSISDSAIRNDTNETEPNANLHEQDNLYDSTKMAASQVLEDKQPVHILPVNLSTLRDAGIQVITQEGINKQLSKNVKQRHLGVQFSSSSPNILNQSHSQLHDMTGSDNCFETEVLGHEEKAQSEHCISSTKIRTSHSCSNNETLRVKTEPQAQKREESKSVKPVIDSSDSQNPLVGIRDNQQSAINDDFDVLQTPKKLEIAVEEKCIGKSPKRKCLQPKRRSIQEESPAKLSSSSTADRTFNVPATTKGDPPNLKEKETHGQVASDNSLEFCNAEDAVDIPHVLEQLLSNTEIHQKLAENINKVKYKGQDAPPTPQTPAPDVLDDFLIMPEADLPSEAITDVIEMTKHDPVFDSLFKLFSIDKNDFLEKEYGPNFAHKPRASFHENQQGTEEQSQQSTKAHETLASGEKSSELQQQTQQHVINTQPTEKPSSDLPTTPSRNARRAQSLNKKTANKRRSKGRPTKRAASKLPVLLPAPPVQSRTLPDISRFRNIAPKCTSETPSGIFKCVVVNVPSTDTNPSIQSVEPATKASSMAAVAFSSTASPLCLDSKQVPPNTAAVSVPGADHSSTMVRSSTAAASVPPAGHSTPRKEAEKPSTKWSPATKAHETLASGEKSSELQQQTQQHVINTQPTEKPSSDLPTTPSRNARRAQSLNKKTANKRRSKGRPTKRAASKLPVLLPAPPVQSRTLPDISRFRNIAPKCTSETPSGIFKCVVVNVPSTDTIPSIQSVEPATKASSMAAVAFSSTASPLCLDSKQVPPNTAAVSVPGADHSSTMVRSSTAAASVPPAGHSTPRKEAEKPSTKWSPGLKALINMASPEKPIIEISVEKNQGLKPSTSRSKSSKPSVPLNVAYVPDGLLSTELLKDNNSDSSPTASLLQSSDKSTEQQQEISGICSGLHTNSTFQTISPGAILLTPSSDSTAHSHLGYFHSPCPAAQGGMVEGNNMSKKTITKHVRVLSFKKDSKVSKPVTAKSKAALPTDEGVICDKKQRRRAPKTDRNVETNFFVGKRPIETINVFQERKLPSLHPKKNLNSKKETVRDLLRAKMEGKKIAQGNDANQVAMPSAENAQQVILSDLVCPPQSKDLLTQKTNGIDLTFVEKSDLCPASDALAAPALRQHPSAPAFSRQTWATVFGENSNQAYQPYPCIEKAKPDCTERRRQNKHIHKHKHKNINHKRSCSKYSTKKYESGQLPVFSFSAPSVLEKVESNPPTQGDMCTAISPQPILQMELTSPAVILPTVTSSQTAPHIINDDAAGNNQLLPCSDSSATTKFVSQELHKSEMTAAMFTSVKDNIEHSTVEPTSKLTPVPSKTIQDSNESEVAETLVCLATRLPDLMDPDLENTTASLQMATGGKKVDSSQEMKPRGRKRRERGKCDEPRAKKSKLKKLSKMDVDKFLSKLHG
ncbi:cell wall protein DAN4 [Lingula anatina]|uniref:Cell wall protein DAN4 n=1 Tax=Lingula anatina TaxID=7574 RepID=A0A1S3ITJ4_LINAN|nr:cell wall protein DAN4 [Lingula anatina]|eukprot:XP_013401530.1 cell wall protein DAN4 [Lingula anatina]